MREFDLEAAKRGEPIVCRDGTPARFIAYVPDAMESNRLLVLIDGTVFVCYENGSRNCYGNPAFCDLFMAPKKRTVWVNLYRNGLATFQDTEEYADRSAGKHDGRIGNRAYPVEIEE